MPVDGHPPVTVSTCSSGLGVTYTWGMAASPCGVARTCLIVRVGCILQGRSRCTLGSMRKLSSMLLLESIQGVPLLGSAESVPPPPPPLLFNPRVWYCTSCLVGSLSEPTAAYVSTICNLPPGLTELNHPSLTAGGEGLFPIVSGQ